MTVKEALEDVKTVLSDFDGSDIQYEQLLDAVRRECEVRIEGLGVGNEFEDEDYP